VVGVLALVAFFGFVSLGAFLAIPTIGISLPVFGGGSILCLLAGMFLLRLSKRLKKFDPSARDAQLVASILLLFFFPFGTALGIYGLVALSGDAARRAFATLSRAPGGLHAWRRPFRPVPACSPPGA